MRYFGKLVILAVALGLPGAMGRAADKVDFARDIQPILSENCYACHGPDEEERSADLRLDTEEGARSVLVPGDVSGSDLVARITTHEADELMPPPDKKERLDAGEIALISRWIEEGAEWGRHWAFEAPVRPGVPGNGTAHPVDAFVAARLELEGLEFSEPADAAKQLRRVSLDLTGLPPSLEELDAFLGDLAGGEDAAWERAVGRLLDSPHYGERWARWWMDAARYADSNGYEKDSVRYVWPYRDWLIDSFNGNEPYDRFVIRQVGGDLLENATLEDRVATGFLRNSMVNEEGAIDAEQFRIEGIFDRMDAIGKSVLGLTVQCVQCHSHKYDPITQEEYYGMFAYLNNAHEATVPYYGREDRAAIAAIESGVEALREKVRAGSGDWRASLDDWIAQRRAEIAAEPEWTPVTPRHLGDGGQKFYAQPDGSIMTRGYSPARSTEKFAGEAPLERIGSLRLELLMHPYLTYGGPGRSIEGTAAISELKLLAGSDPARLEPVKFRPAVSDLDPPSRPIDMAKYPGKDGTGADRTEGPAAFINDGDAKTAWTTEAGWSRSNQPRVVVLDLEEPLVREGDGPLHLQFEIACQHGGWNSNDNQHRNLGRFRLSFAAEALGCPDLVSPRVREILGRPEEQWSETDQAEVFDAWLEDEPRFAEAAGEIRERLAGHPAPTPQLVMQEREKARKTLFFHRGEQTHPRHEVRPHVPAFIHDLPENAPAESRLTFARWLVDREAPTAARAFVNRTWMAFFGTGIVESVEDLGHQATRPSHPELLDWLSVEFMESGWDVKHLHRLIVSSRTYRQSSEVPPTLGEIDPRNRLLARGPRFRPDAEVVRDIQLAASGLLDRSVGGDSVRPPIPRFLFDPPASYGYKTWKVDTSPEKRYRRALYTFRFRTVPPPFLSAFDAPSGEVACVRRPRSTTPLQALALLNEPLSVEAAEGLARKIEEEAEGKGGMQAALVRAFRQCTSRIPSEEEIAVLAGLVENERKNGADPWLAVSRVLLNLDETITKS